MLLLFVVCTTYSKSLKLSPQFSLLSSKMVFVDSSQNTSKSARNQRSASQLIIRKVIQIKFPVNHFALEFTSTKVSLSSCSLSIFILILISTTTTFPSSEKYKRNFGNSIPILIFSAFDIIKCLVKILSLSASKHFPRQRNTTRPERDVKLKTVRDCSVCLNEGEQLCRGK